MAIHELGHTGFRLADEYGGCTPGQPNRYTRAEPGEPNVTTITDRGHHQVAQPVLWGPPAGSAVKVEGWGPLGGLTHWLLAEDGWLGQVARKNRVRLGQ